MERQKLIDSVPDSVTPFIIYEETTDIWINVRIGISAFSDSLLIEALFVALENVGVTVLPTRIFPLCKFCAYSVLPAVKSSQYVENRDLGCESRTALLEAVQWSGRARSAAQGSAVPGQPLAHSVSC